MSEFMRSVKTLALGILLGVVGLGLHAQAKPATAATKAAPQPQAKPAAQVPAKAGASAAATQAKPPAAAASKTAAQPQAKPAPAATKPAQATAKPAPAATKPAAQGAKAGPAAKSKAKNPAAKKARKPVTSAKPKPAEPEKEPKIARRDPFASLIGREQAGGTRTDLPPGKAGLQVGTLRLDGIVRAPNGMIAVVSNPQSRTYFLREGDQLYDGRVEKIAMDGVSFHEIGKDAFGKPVERQVNKRIYASAGEQQ
jgi:Tfp pilus assembly protein PilP